MCTCVVHEAARGLAAIEGLNGITSSMPVMHRPSNSLEGQSMCRQTQHIENDNTEAQILGPSSSFT